MKITFIRTTEHMFYVLNVNPINYFNKSSLVKFIIIIQRILFLGLILLLIACNSNKPVPRVGILSYGDSRLPQINGFLQGMADYGYQPEKSIQYISKTAENQPEKLFDLAVQLLKQKSDVLVAAGGLEADALKQALAGMLEPPVVILQIGSILERGLVKDRLQPEWAVTGVDNLNVELSAKRIELIKLLKPDVRQILMFRTQGAKPGERGVEVAKQRARQLGIDIRAENVINQRDIQYVMSNLQQGDVDFLLTVTTPLVNQALKEIILPRAALIDLPVFVQSEGWGELGAVASFGAPYVKLGKQASRLVDKILRGEPVSGMPFETPQNFAFMVNTELLEKYGLSLSPNVRAMVDGTFGRPVN